MGTDWGAPCRVHHRRYPCNPFPGCQAVPLLPASGRTSACAQAAKKQINRGTGLQEPQTAAETDDTLLLYGPIGRSVIIRLLMHQQRKRHLLQRYHQYPKKNPQSSHQPCRRCLPQAFLQHQYRFPSGQYPLQSHAGH